MADVKWTKEQQDAIYDKGSNILVAAAAGSGKTAVLVERIINKVINENVDIDKILVVTFTNAAASEMRERILEAIYKKMEEFPDNKNLQRQIILINKASIDIHNGEFSISPKKIDGVNQSCTFCKYKDLCFVKYNDFIDLEKKEFKKEAK